MQQNPSTNPTKARSGRRTLIWAVVVVALVLAGGVGGAFGIKGRSFTAPDWLRVRIVAQIEDALPDLDVSIGRVVVSLADDWRPGFALRDLRVNSLQGTEIIAVSGVSGAVDKAALFEGRLGLTSLEASGVFLTLLRTADGSVTLRAGAQPLAASRKAPDLARLVADLDEFLLRPAISGLTAVTVDGVILRYEDARAGRAWTVDGGRLRFNRKGLALQIAADLAILDGDGDVATLSANYAGLIGQQGSDFGMTLTNLDARDIASQGPALSWLQVLQAPISGALRGGVNEDGSYDTLNVTLQIGAGVIQPTPKASPIPIKGARSYFAYLPDEQRLRFDEFLVDSDWGTGRLEGQAVLGAIKDGQIQDLVGQFRLTGLSINPDGLYPEPVSLGASELDFRLRLAPFALEVGRFQVIDRGQILSAYGDISVGNTGWNIAMDGQLDGLDADRLIALWPERLEPKSRKWIAKNVKAGQVRQATAAVRIAQGGAPRLSLGFDFQDAEFTVTDELPPVREAKGHASFDKDRFVVVVDQAQMQAPQGGVVRAAGTSFIVPDTKAKPDPPGVLRLTAGGSVTAALSLLDLPPLEVMKKTNLPVALAEGHMQVVGTAFLPLKKGADIEEFAFDLQGELSDVRSAVLVEDRVLEAGRLALSVTDDAVQIAGQGTLDSVPLDVVWRQKLGRAEDVLPGQLTGTVEISPEALTAFDIDLPADMVQGQTTAAITLDMLKGVPPRLALRSDLRGARLALTPVGWSKPAGQAGLLEVDVTLGDAPTVDRLVLSAPGLEAAGTLSLTPDAQLDRLRFDRVQLGNWLDAPVDIIGRGAGLPVGIEVIGGSVDLRRMDLPPQEPSTEPGGPLTVALDRLQVSDTIALTGLRGEFSTTGGLAGNFAGAINGAAPVTGRVTPQNGRSAVRLQAKDAGRVASAAGLVQRLRDGRMDLTLVPVGTGGAFDGKLSIKETRITGAPAIAALLNSISVVGLINELSGDGIYFSEVSADFRLAPSRITLREASAVGASMGLSMDGVFEPDTGRIQMQGVISPVYILNSIGSVLTRRGEGLFGFNYSITGTTEEPEVFVNPLTALAPGMLRNLFRGAEPEVPLEDGETAPEPPPRRAPVVTRGEDR